MEIGNKIKQLRYRFGLTQEQLAEKLCISAQSVSKWETGITMPDITLLPLLAGEFGVSIDELFDLTIDQKLHRIESRLELDEEISVETFKEYEDFLKMQRTEHQDKAYIFDLLAGLYHHRMEVDAKKVGKYARESIQLHPERKASQWFLDMAEGQAVWDWNIAEHSSIIDFYKEVIRNDKEKPASPLPYYYLIDNLIADHRTKEATEYLDAYQTLPAHKPFMVVIYRAHIALAEFDEQRADGIIENGLKEYDGVGGFLFEAAQYYARKCDYEKAIDLYAKSWKAEENCKPRYTDSLHGIAKIYSIIGKKEEMRNVYDEILDALKNEWGLSNEDRAVVETERERNRILVVK